MNFLIILIATILIFLVVILNAFHSLLLSQRNIKIAREKVADTILYYFDIVPRQLLLAQKLESDSARNFFERKVDLIAERHQLPKLFELYSLQIKEFSSEYLQKQELKIAELLHGYNQSVIKYEHKLDKSRYAFLAKLMNLKLKDHVIGDF